MKQNSNFTYLNPFLFQIELSNDCIMINLIKAKINLVNCNYLRKPSFWFSGSLVCEAKRWMYIFHFAGCLYIVFWFVTSYNIEWEMIRIPESAHEVEFLFNLCVATYPFRWRFHTIYLINLLLILMFHIQSKNNVYIIKCVWTDIKEWQFPRKMHSEYFVHGFLQ